MVILPRMKRKKREMRDERRQAKGEEKKKRL